MPSQRPDNTAAPTDSAQPDDDWLAISQMLDDGCPNCFPDPADVRDPQAYRVACSTVLATSLGTGETVLVRVPGEASPAERLRGRLLVIGRWLASVFFQALTAAMLKLIGG